MLVFPYGPVCFGPGESNEADIKATWKDVDVD